MTSEDPQGVIYADNANGFLIGDVSLGGLQFAVKGAFGSPQSFTMIINWLKKIKEQDFSFEALLGGYAIVRILVNYYIFKYRKKKERRVQKCICSNIFVRESV